MNTDNDIYQQKYLKYKNKYLALKSQQNAGAFLDVFKSKEKKAQEQALQLQQLEQQRQEENDRFNNYMTARKRALEQMSPYKEKLAHIEQVRKNFWLLNSNLENEDYEYDLEQIIPKYNFNLINNKYKIAKQPFRTSAERIKSIAYDYFTEEQIKFNYDINSQAKSDFRKNIPINKAINW